MKIEYQVLCDQLVMFLLELGARSAWDILALLSFLDLPWIGCLLCVNLFLDWPCGLIGALRLYAVVSNPRYRQCLKQYWGKEVWWRWSVRSMIGGRLA